MRILARRPIWKGEDAARLLLIWHEPYLQQGLFVRPHFGSQKTGSVPTPFQMGRSGGSEPPPSNQTNNFYLSSAKNSSDETR